MIQPVSTLTVTKADPSCHSNTNATSRCDETLYSVKKCLVAGRLGISSR
jgi:hypothetical protein